MEECGPQLNKGFSSLPVLGDPGRKEEREKAKAAEVLAVDLWVHNYKNKNNKIESVGYGLLWWGNFQIGEH